MRNTLIPFLILTVFLSSCGKDDLPVRPEIEILTNEGYARDGDTSQVGKALRFGIIARGPETELTNLVIRKRLTNGLVIPMLDTGIFVHTLQIDKVFFQGVEEEVIWEFFVQDRNRLTAQTQITLYRDPHSAFGGILEFPSITMGYQENTSFGQFLNASAGKVFFADSASIFPDSMDILTYFILDEDLPSPVFSSPGEYDNYSTEAGEFYPAILQWPIRHYVKWDISVDDDPISVTAFDQCHNDSLLIVSYDDVWGKKKFKWATTGRVIPFLTSKGKKGLIKVLRADSHTQGSIEFALKIQI